MFSHLCQRSTHPRCFIIVLIYGIRNRCQVRWENKKEEVEVMVSTTRGGEKKMLLSSFVVRGGEAEIIKGD